MLKKQSAGIVLWGTILFVAWNALLRLFFWTRPAPGRPPSDSSLDDDPASLTHEVIRLAQDTEVELERQQGLLQQVREHHAQWRQRLRVPTVGPLPHRMGLYPIIVNQDCGHEETAQVIASYSSAITHTLQPDLSNVTVSPDHHKFQSNYKITQHYCWTLGQIFHRFKFSAAVVVEDDLEVAPDFFEYFQATYPMLRADPSLWCVSAWNNNNKEQMVDSNKPELLYRTDFFPSLGWLLLAKLWDELEPKWPKAFWDDWIRRPEQRQGQACVQPEISRTITFSRKGVSHEQFFDQHLKFIKLNQHFVHFTQLDLSYLRGESPGAGDKRKG
ncbi:LOW QUALITY PROTEIN: alpha-1,3-mannosyl-glycoprotein 2-beta-N-acetylglucosaminyltransferase-like [Orycteropus afer afer]|uniref:Alpha-1,3-mannosyl-glycoprotein 2-beta-N-acetylglucosaminyltransferase n=1 Tax=Orycteropus afer afer TaxID=1230840 RepID=A0A8B7B4K5_ORYAF|nr:LOW QUALITY PROTEIN: alpha-1,3-mannosyl-glycoprotein 2-beta-N-acetylglucosaminyltransferase-like [Orycteropus afer afer]